MGLRRLLLAVAVVAFATGAHAADPPSAGSVVLRGKKAFADALAAATNGAAGRPVALVLDVTPFVRKAADALREGLRLADPAAKGAPWAIGRLGEPLSPSVPGPAALAPLVAALVAEDTPSRNTVADLRKTLRSVKATPTVLVYLCDWHFEDDEGLEDFVKELGKKSVEFHAIGSEAAFGRGWNDGAADDRIRFSSKGSQAYEPGIGRNPFASEPDAPWHGGETAFPHVPYRWHVFLWNTEFTEADKDMAADAAPPRPGGVPPPFPFGGDPPAPGRDGEPPLPEDLLERLRRGRGEPSDPPPAPPEPSDGADPMGDVVTRVLEEFPLPSGFGPYGLMRAASATGGRYVVFSWNPEGRSKVRYDYARCDLFAPDLRSRKDILADVPRRPLATAVQRAWEALASARADVLEHTPPLEGARTPRSVDEIEGRAYAPFVWDTPGEHRDFVRNATAARAALAEALDVLATAIEGREDPKDPVDRRFLADARLFAHEAEVVRFELGEALAAAKELPQKAWSTRGKKPGLSDRDYVVRGRDPEKVRPTEEKAFDPVAGKAVVEARRRHLERYRGTPFAERVALNPVLTFRFGWWEVGGRPPGGRMPGESVDPAEPSPPPVTPGGGSGGGGPTTGG